MGRRLLPVLWFTLLLFLLSGCREEKAPEITGNEDILWTASWSPDGKYIATGGNHDTLSIFSGKGHRGVKAYPFAGTITKLKWHPTEDLLAVAVQTSTDKTSLLDPTTGVLIPLDSLPPSGARGIGWNFDGSTLAVGDNEGRLSFFTRDGKWLRTVNTGQKAITGLDWHPSSNLVVTVGRRIELYDFNQDTNRVVRPRPVEVLMLCVAWHPSGTFFVTGDYGDFEKNYPPLLQFWDEQGAKIREIGRSQAEYRNLSWSSDGAMLATASEALRIWSKDGRLLREGASEDLLWGVAWSPDGQRIATSSEQGRVVLWNQELESSTRLK